MIYCNPWCNRSVVVGAGLLFIGLGIAVNYPTPYKTALTEIRNVGGSTDVDLSEDSSLPVRQVMLFGPSITDAEVERVAPHLPHLPELFTLNLGMAHVTDRGLCHLRGLNQLGDLLLRYTQVSDKGLNSLEGWTNLHTLDLYQTNITDDGLETIAKNLPSLQALCLGNTRVTDRGLIHLKRLPKLEWLSLSNTNITDAGVKTLSEMPSLQTLALDGTQVTDESLKALKNLNRLQTLNGQKIGVR